MSLKVDINKAGTITIRFSAADLKFATKFLPSLESFDEESGRFLLPKITDAKAFAQSVFRYGLCDEAEDGTTRVHQMLDDAILEAVEQGAEGILLPDDPDYGKKVYAD